LLEYNKEIRICSKLSCGYQYFCDNKCPIANANGYVYYHRYIAPVKLGRWLKSEEHVHHIDRNKLNNDPNNLMILNSSEHAALESYLRCGDEKFNYCILCGKIISKHTKNFLCVDCYNKNRPEEEPKDCYYLGLTCMNCGKIICNTNTSGLCVKCSHNLTRLFDPNKEELERLVWEIPTTKVAKIFGVTDQAINKRCKVLGISKPPRGYWAKKYANKL
jgi:hypothetical protein